MKIKQQFLYFAMIFCLLGYGQETNPDMQVPDFFPSSPEAGSFGKYGNITTSMHTGNMNFSIPIHTFQLGNYSWPISLQYRYGGLLLEGKQSLVGLGWSLSAAGAITREVRGLPDEHTNGYYGTTNRGARINDYVANNNEFTLAELRNFSKGVWDKEADIYHVSAGGVQFSFKIGINGNPVYLSQHNHKVSYADQQITVTDDNGIKYLFAELEKNEPSDASPSTTFEYTITWNLSQVIYPTGKSLTFQYQADQYYSYDFYANASVRYFPTGLNGSSTPAYGTAAYDDGMNRTIINRKILTGITYNSGSNTNNSESVNFFVQQGNNGKRYASIGISSGFGVNDTYIFTHHGNRDLLVDVVKNNERVYGFEYYDQNTLPQFMDALTDRPYAQDDWRFFNAKPNTHAVNIPSLPSSNYSVDKNPDFNATRIGAMKKIIYPTGGYSEVFYEQHQIKDDSPLSYNTVPFNRQWNIKLQSDNNASAQQVKQIQSTYTFDTPVVATISSELSGNISNSEMAIQITRVGTCPPSENQPTLSPVSDDYHENAAYFRQVLGGEIPEMCPTLEETLGPDEGFGYRNYSNNSGGRIIIKPGTYTLKIVNKRNRTSDAYGEIKIQFYEPTGQEGFVNTNIGGVRVSKIYHYDDPTTNHIARKQYYNYNGEDGYSTGILTNKVSTLPFNVVTHTPLGTSEYTDIVYPINRFNSMDADLSTPVFYTSVIEASDIVYVADPNASDGISNPLLQTNEDGSPILSDIGNQEDQLIPTYPLGYTQTIFDTPFESYESMYPNHPRSKDLDKGRIKETKLYKNDGTQLSLVQKTNLDYQLFRAYTDQQYHDQDDNDNHPWSLKIGLKQNIVNNFTVGGCTFSNNPPPELEFCIIDNYAIQPYREVHKKFKPTETINTSVFYENGNSRQVVSEVSNTYNLHYAVRETETTNTDGSISKVVYNYPYDVDTEFPGMSTLTAVYKNTLNLDNRIAQPIQTRSYHKEGTTETLMVTQRTDFKSWGNNVLGNNLLLPEKVLLSKGANALEERLVYHNYDITGNLLEASKKDDTQSHYIWGYNAQLPIARINNTTATELAALQSQVQAAVNASNADNDRTLGNLGNEGVLRIALQALQNALPANAQMVYYTYDPLIGVTSMTDAKGYTMYYEYDNLTKRRTMVKDAEGKILTKNEYNLTND